VARVPHAPAGGDSQRLAAPPSALLYLELIVPSSTNPRREANSASLDELTESIRAHGVLQPILVRPFDGPGYKIVAGHRRAEAARRAGFLQIPAVIRDLSDEEALELQVVENLQRSDLHPLEEAEGYRQLMATKHYDVARIAERVGRSIKYVYDRVKLLSLTKRAQVLFLDGKITAGHAVILAGLKPQDQERCIGGRDETNGFLPGPLFWAEEQREAKRRAGAAAKDGATGEKRYEIEERRRREQQEREELLRKRWQKAVPEILKALAERIRKMPARATGLLAETVATALKSPRRKGADPLLTLVPRGKTAEDLVRHAAFLVLMDELEDWGAPRNFPKRAKAFGVDTGAILEKAAPVQTSAKPSAGAAGSCRKCGCTEEKACPGGCGWADETKTLCTRCAPAKKAKKRKGAK